MENIEPINNSTPLDPNQNTIVPATDPLMTALVNSYSASGGDVANLDLKQLSTILEARNTHASGLDDPLDLDGDGVITILDARIFIVESQSNQDTIPPDITGALVNDTGVNNTDGVTFDPIVGGTVTDNSPIVGFHAGFGDDLLDVSSTLQSDGSFILDQNKLEELNGGSLVDGEYTLKLAAEDDAGNVSSTFEVNWTLDTTAPTATISNAVNTSTSFIEVSYNEDVSDSAFVTNNYTLAVQGGENNGQTIEIASVEQLNANKVRLNLTQSLDAQVYELAIDEAVVDLAGNSLTDSQVLSFIVDADANVVEISPFNGEEMVALTRETIVRFDKKVDPDTVTEESFYLIANGERIEGRIVVSSTEEFATFFYDKPLPQSTEVRVFVDGDKIIGRDGQTLDADGNGIPGGIETADFRTLPLTQIPGTDVFGYVYDSYNTNEDGSNIPLEGVVIRLDSLPDVFAVTDENGYFKLEDVPAPDFYVYIDGSNVKDAPAGTQYASLGKAFHSVPGQEIQLEMDGEPFDVYLPAMAASDIMELSDTEDTNVGFGEASLAFLQSQFPDVDPEIWQQTQVTFVAGSATDDQGNAATQAMIVPVDPERLPAPLPPGANPGLVISIQAGGENGFNREANGGATNFDVPAPVTFPNLEGLAPGEKSLIWTFNHDAGDWEIIGTGTVSEDGKSIVSDEGVGIRAPGWHFTISGTRSRFEIGSRGSGAGSGPDFLNGDFPIQNGTFTPNLVQQAFLLDRILPDSVLESVLRGGLKIFTSGEFDALADQFVDRFIAGTGGTFTHDVGSDLSNLAKNSDTIKGVVGNLETSISNMIQMQANGGAIDNRNLNVTIPNNISFPLLDSPSLKGLIGGTQETTIFIEYFDATATIDSPETGGSGEYSATLRLEILDDFGVDESDLYTLAPFPPLYNFWILQHERIGPAPFVNEIIIEVPIEGEFTVPPGFEDVIINIDSADNTLQNFQFLSENLNAANNAFIFDTQEIENQILNAEIIQESTVSGFGNNPQVFYRYIMENGLEITGSIDPGEPIQNLVLPPNQFFTVSFYQPSTNSSTSIASITSPSGEFSLFSDSPGGQGESDSKLNLDTFGGLDSDGDGIPDIGEEVMGTDANSADSDGDGISDAAELEQGLDPLGGQAFPTGIISSLPLQGEAKAVTVEGSILEAGGQTAYIATGSHGLAIVDASQFNNPIIMGQLNLLGDATDIAVDNNLQITAVASNNGGLQLVDVSDPMLPKLQQTVNITPNQVEVFDGVAYATVGNSLEIIDLLTGESLQSLVLPGSGTVTGMAREGTKLYTFTSGSDTFSVIDIANQGSANVLGQLNTSIASSDVGVFVGNGVAYLAGSGLRTIDISNPSSPSLISDADFFSTARNVTLNGSGIALVAAKNQGIGVYDITDPQNTNNVLFTVDTPGFARDIAIASGIAFVADDSGGLQVINYLPFDNQGEAPTVTITTSVTDLDPEAEGIQVLEGTTIPIQANVLDDVQVRNVELLVNGEVVRNDVSFPFDFSAIAPNINPDSGTATLQIRATDTGGNTALSDLLSIELVPDTFAPSVLSIDPSDGGIDLVDRQTVRIRFSEALAAETVNNGTFQLLGENNTLLNPIDLQLRNDDQLVQLTFDPLPVGSYQLVISAEKVTDRAGNALGQEDIISSFTLEEATTLTLTDLNSLTPELLAQSIVGEGVIIDNVTFTGANQAAGIFSGGLSAGIDIAKGIILSSGNIINAAEPNDSDGSSTSFSNPGDEDLNALIPQNTNDAVVLEFDFIPEQNQVSFRYVFASEEYNEFVGSFNDVFAFFLDGENIALIPETTTPVSIDNVNKNANSEFYKDNDPSDLGTPTPFKVEYDGFTTVLTAQANIEAGVPHRIKLAIADASDTSLDSAVFLEASSFIGKDN